MAENFSVPNSLAGDDTRAPALPKGPEQHSERTQADGHAIRDIRRWAAAQFGMNKQAKAQNAANERHRDQKPDNVLWRKPKTERADQLYIATTHLPGHENGGEECKTQSGDKDPEANIWP